MTSRPRRVLAVMHRAATRARWLLAFIAAWVWFFAFSPTSEIEIYIGAAVLIGGHRALAPAGVRARRRASLRPRILIGVVTGILFGVAAPQAWAVPQGDLCRVAPTAETTGGGLTGFLDPQQDLPMDGTPYGDRGYAGTFWVTYDVGCASAGAGLLLDQTLGLGAVGRAAADASTEAGHDTQLGNLMLSASKTILAYGTGMRARANDADQFDGLDSIMVQGVQGLRDLLITPWMAVPLLLLGIYLIILSRTGDVSQTLYRTLVALASLGLIVVLGEQPLMLASWADQQVVAMRNWFDEGYVERLPEDLIPITQHCEYDLTQFDQAPVWDALGQLVIDGTPCTPNVRSSLNPEHQWTDDGSGVLRLYNPAYFTSGYFYAEVMYSNLIFPAWQEGLIGTRDRSGPNYDLAMLFLRGQSLTTFDLASSRWRNEAENNAPIGAVWCTFVDNKKTCGVSDSLGPPGRLIDNAEADYMAAIDAAGDERYPYIQGKAGNRTAAGATALAAVAAAVPFPAAADTGVWAARLLLRIGVIAGLVLAFVMILVPAVLRHLRRALTTTVTLLLLLSGLGSLMTWMTLQLIANPAVYGSLGYQGGLIILAGITVVLWLVIRPMKRIGGMLSTSLTNDPNTLSNMRRGAMRTLTSPLRRGMAAVAHGRLLRAVKGAKPGGRGRRGKGGGDPTSDDFGETETGFDEYGDEEFSGPRPESAAAAAAAAAPERPTRSHRWSRRSRSSRSERSSDTPPSRRTGLGDPHSETMPIEISAPGYSTAPGGRGEDQRFQPGWDAPDDEGPRRYVPDNGAPRWNGPEPRWNGSAPRTPRPYSSRSADSEFNTVPHTDDGWAWWADSGPVYAPHGQDADVIIDAEVEHNVEPNRNEIFRPEPVSVTGRPIPRSRPVLQPVRPELEYEIFRPRPELPAAPPLALSAPGPRSENGAP